MEANIHKVILSLGSNLGDRKKNLAEAVKLLEEFAETPILSSNIYETPPWGVTDQPAFLNMVLSFDTRMSAEALLEAALSIELILKRERKRHWGERTIDLDILYYGDLVIVAPNLIVPHPLLHKRLFVLIPLLDIAPNFRHPVLGKTTKELLEGLGG